jgi:hypothetical protein
MATVSGDNDFPILRLNAKLINKTGTFNKSLYNSIQYTARTHKILIPTQLSPHSNVLISYFSCNAKIN